MSQARPPFSVRLGLGAIRALVRLKAVTRGVFGVFALLSRPVSERVFRFIVLPLYGLTFGLRRRLSNFYRPSKNRLMFLLINRYAVHAVVIAIAVVAGTVNFGLGEVRAESDAFGQSSILYSLVTKQAVEVIEEYSALERVDSYVVVSSFGENSLQAPLGGSAAIEPTTSMLGLSQHSLAGGFQGGTTGTVVPPPITALRNGSQSYTIATGDTLSTISQKFGISLNTLLWANNLTVRSVIQPGGQLIILPVSGVSHTIKNGDTLSALAKKYSVGTETILAYNNLASADALSIGQSLIIPGGQLIAPTPSNRTVAVRDIFTGAPAGAGGSTKPNAGAVMTWPTDLRYIVRGMSLYHTGVDIDCSGRRDGTSTNDNYAAMDGIVQFAGFKSGYGYTVEIDHGNGLVTRYGHFHSLYVSSGTAVLTGTPLGRCGSTGTSTGTHLHFEVIANGKFKNPANYLGY